MKAQSDLLSGALLVSAALIVTILVGSMILSVAKLSTNSTEDLAKSEIDCSYSELYSENASFDSNGDCTQGVNHTLSIVIRNGGDISAKIGNVVVETENGNLSYFYIGQNISPKETRSFSLQDENSCVNFIEQNQSGYESKIKSIHIGSVSCPSIESLGRSRIILFNSNQTESRIGRYMMGMWHFNSSLSDSSFFGNHGSFSGGSPSYVAGVNTSFGNSIQLDGINDYIMFGSNQSLNITNNLTIEFWVKSYSNGSSVISKCR